MKTLVPFFALLLFWTACTTQSPEKNSVKLSFIEVPTGENSSLPYLIEGRNGALYLSWVEKSDSNWTDLKYSKFDGNVWTAPELIARGNNWFVNWADYPMIAVDKSGNMIAHYLAKSSAGTYSYNVNVVVKAADSKNWSAPVIPHNDSTATEHGFVTILPQSNETFLLAWLDGRNTAEEGNGDHEGQEGGAMTIRTATIDMEGNLTNDAELDAKVCDCCQTAGTMTASGPMIAYRDRSEEEIRDIFFVKDTDKGWTSPKPVGNDNWKIEGCPVNGPGLASFNDQVVAVWFTAAAGKPTMKAAFLDQQSFGKPITIDNRQPLGRVDVVAIDDQSAIVTWLAQNEGQSYIMARKINKDGTMDDKVRIAPTSGSRGSGFPRMAFFMDEIYIVWTVFGEGRSDKIKMVKYDVQ